MIPRFGVAVTTYRNPNRDYLILIVKAQLVKDIAAAKIAFTKILNGTTIKHNGEVIWTSSLSSGGSTLRKLKKIEKDHGVIIVCDRRNCELRLLGDPKKFGVAQWAVFATISAESPWTKVSLLKSKGLQVEHVPQSEGKPVDNNDCTICWTTAENPVSTKCGHVYCMECFQNLCKAAGTSGKTFSLTCQGCQTAFGLEELCGILSTKALEEVLEASFASHLQRNQGTYHYCPMPDCGGIYRLTDKTEVNSCAKCFTIICMSCFAPHGGKTCAEHQYELTDEYIATAKLKKELNIKDCPNCGIGIEKVDGCNNVVCNSCHVAICWKCLEFFPDYNLCYAHLEEKHGGPYDGAQVYLNPAEFLGPQEAAVYDGVME